MMPAILTHKAIMLMAKERVHDIRNVLKKRIDNTSAKVTSLDRQLLAIADETLTIFTSEPRPRTELGGLSFVEAVANDNNSYPISQYAVLGSMGPHATTYTDILSPQQQWLIDTISKGTPDSNRELVNAQSCDFIMQFWEGVKQGITSETNDQSEREANLQKMRAFVLGHFCHIAGSIVTRPYINDYEREHAANQTPSAKTVIEKELDAIVATQLLGREGAITDNEWDKWWPSENLPEPFYEAYSQALESIYGANSDPRKGLQQFDEQFQTLGSPIAMNASFIKDGYNAFRNGVIEKGFGFGYWTWFGWMALFFGPALVLPLIVAALPHGKNIFLKDDQKRTERAWMEFLTTPMLFALPASIGYGALIGSITTRGVEDAYWLGMAGSIVSAVAGISMLATLAVEDLPAAVSWPLFFVIPLIFSGLQSVLGIVSATQKDKLKTAVTVIHSAPLALLLVFFLFFGVFPGLIAPDDNADSPFTSEGFWITFALWVAAIAALWFLLPDVLKKSLSLPEQPSGDIVNRRFVRLFDDTSLHHDQLLSDDNIPAQVYPSGFRELLKLWWTGSGELFVRCDRYQLVFSSHADGRDPQIVSAPLAPMTMQEYIDFLTATVVDPGTNNTGNLQASTLHPEDHDYALPAGALFANHADKVNNLAAELISEQEADSGFQPLGSTESSTENSTDASLDYVLYHSEKVSQSVRFGQQGPVTTERNLDAEAPIINENVDSEGWSFVESSENPQSPKSLMNIAADFAALLSMSAVTHLAPNLKDNRDQEVNKIYQVFKNWNLDSRRLNEWRTLVSGNAINERGVSRSGYTDNMLGQGLGPADSATWREALRVSDDDTSAFDQGELTARQMGWTTVLNDWLEINRDLNADSLNTDTAGPGKPTNQALSRAMAYLLDLPDPEEST